MGAVFLADDRKLERPVAIKVLPPELIQDESFVGRFEREARTAAKLDHPGIIPIYSVEAADDLHFFVMKYVTGQSLDAILRSGPMPIDLVQRILWEAAVALGHAHTRGVVHRDVKPANIMIDDSGRTVLTDFGISKAKSAATQFTATGQVIGTPHYMSPEQTKGREVDGRSDQYSLAIVGYRMLTGRLPFADDSVHTIIYKHVFEDPDPVEQDRPDCPPFLATAIRRALAKNPDDRFSTMEAFASAVWPENPVTATVSSRSSLGRVSSTEEPTQLSADLRTGRGKRAALIAAALIVVVAGGASAWWFTLGGGAESAPPESGVEAVMMTGAAGGQPGAQDPVQAGDSSTVTAAAEDTTRTVEQPPSTPERQPTRTPTPVRPRPAAVQPAAPRVGWLTINATPFGTVFVDGVEQGDTPLVSHELSPGRHIIEVRREGYRTVADTVMITAGNTTRLQKTLIPDQP
jgi:hypothetical protein